MAEEDDAPKGEAAGDATPGESKTKTAADYLKEGKIVIFFKSAGNAPPLKQKRFKLDPNNNFKTIIEFLRKQLHYKPTDPLFLFINSTFQPHPEESVADLFKCFHNNGRLVVNYSTTAAWG